MKLSQSRRGFLLVVLAGACLLPSVSSAAVTVVGTGPDQSYLVLESPNLGVRTYEVHYTYNPGSPQDAYFLLNQVKIAESYVIVKSDYPDLFSPNYFIQSINGEANTFSPPYTYWVQWVSGGFGYENPDYSYNAGAATRGIWTLGHGISTHFIEPGSWDALFYSDGNSAPSIAPIPETSSAMLAFLSIPLVFSRRRVDDKKSVK